MAFKLEKYLVIGVAIATIVGGAVAGADFLIKQLTADAQLELVSAKASGGEIDIKLRNTGGKVAIVHRATFIIEEHTFRGAAAGPLTPSAAYDVLFPIDASVRSVDLDVSQEIGAGEPDRITLRAGVPPPANGELGGLHTYEGRVVLVYNSPEREVRSGQMTFTLLSAHEQLQTRPQLDDLRPNPGAGAGRPQPVL